MNRITVSAAALVLTALALPPVHAGAATQGYCHIDIVLESPEGLGVEPGTATYTSSGSADCVGTPGGVQATGPGTYTSFGTFEGGCTGASGTFDYRITLPTAQGEAVLEDAGTFISPYFTSPTGFGTFEFTPIEGDCVTAPLTKMRVIAQLIYTG